MSMKIFDLHCDTAYECVTNFGSRPLTVGANHISLDRAGDIPCYIQDFACFMPDELRGEQAVSHYEKIRGYVFSQEKLFPERFMIIKTPKQLEKAVRGSLTGCLFSVEGGSAAAGSFERIGSMYADGVRMMTLTWNARNEIGSGVKDPFDIGLTPFGKMAVRLMNELDMIVDVSHLSDKGFWQVAEIAQKPFAASHSNSRALCPHPRNLTDDMFREIVKQGGIVGLNYSRGFLVPDGEGACVEDIMRHCEHFLELGGEKTVCLGGDMDGTDMPDGITGIESMPKVYGAFVRRFGEKTADDIFFNNAYRFVYKALAHEF